MTITLSGLMTITFILISILILKEYLIININYIIMQMLNFNYNNKFIVDVPKLNGPKLNIKPKINNNCYFVIPFILLIGFMFNINRGLKN